MCFYGKILCNVGNVSCIFFGNILCILEKKLCILREILRISEIILCIFWGYFLKQRKRFLLYFGKCFVYFKKHLVCYQSKIFCISENIWYNSGIILCIIKERFYIFKKKFGPFFEEKFCSFFREKILCILANILFILGNIFCTYRSP